MRTFLLTPILICILIQGNPATKISDVRNVKIVFKDGVGCDPDKLIQSGAHSVGLR